MTEWWTYRLSDFLMFSPRTYGRVVESYNLFGWPAALVAWSAGCLALVLAARHDEPRILSTLLAAAWLWVGWAFYGQRLAPIDLAAPWLAGAFAVEGVMLLLPTSRAKSSRARLPSGASRTIGFVVAASGVLLYPIVLPLALRRPWSQSELFAWMPDPTALATLGFILMGALPLSPAARWVYAVIPLLSLAAGWALQWDLANK